MARAGLRIGEVCSLAPGDLRWPSGLVEVRHGKGDVDRVVPLPRIAWLALAGWQERRPPGAHSWICTLAGRPTVPRYWQLALKRWARRAGLPEPEKVTPHTLRHTYASACLAAGLSLAELRDLLGHRSVATTSMYLHVMPVDVQAHVEEAFAPGGDLAEALRRLPELAMMSPSRRRELAGALLQVARPQALPAEQNGPQGRDRPSRRPLALPEP